MSRIKHLLVAPPLLFFVLVSIIPLVFTVVLSLTNYTIALEGEWIGLDNYRRLFGDRFFLTSYRNTVLYVVLGVAVQYWLGLGLALLVHSLIRGQRWVRLLSLLPFMIPPIVIGFVWQTLLDSRYGPINAFLDTLGIGPVLFLTDPILAFVSILVVDTWQWTPFVFLILFAALRTLPEEPFEAARVDGAKGWRVFWDITFPMLLPASIAAIVLRGIEAFKLFDIVFYITGGGPGNATSTLTLTGYFASLRSGDIGYGAAITVVLLLTVIVFAFVFLLVAQKIIGRSDLSGKEALDSFELGPAPLEKTGGRETLAV